MYVFAYTLCSIPFQLAHDVLGYLKNTANAWLIDVLYAFNSGKFLSFSRILSIIVHHTYKFAIAFFIQDRYCKSIWCLNSPFSVYHDLFHLSNLIDAGNIQKFIDMKPQWSHQVVPSEFCDYLFAKLGILVLMKALFSLMGNHTRILANVRAGKYGSETECWYQYVLSSAFKYWTKNSFWQCFCAESFPRVLCRTELFFYLFFSILQSFHFFNF